MLEFEVQRCTRRCAVTDRELKPGETFYSTLVSGSEKVVRRDYAEESWRGPPAGVLGWWKSEVPDPRARKVHWAPNDVILQYFTELEGRVESQDTRYILALLMIRRRIVRLEAAETDQRGREMLVLYCPRNEAEYRVPVVTPDEQRVRAIQDDLARLLFAHAKKDSARKQR